MLCRLFVAFDIINELLLRYAYVKLYGIIRQFLLWMLGSLFFLPALQAQEEAVLSNWHVLPAYYNSAAAGSSDMLTMGAFYRQQWIGVSGAPGYYGLSVSAPITIAQRTHGVGILLSGSKRGLFTSTELMGQYAFRFKLWKGVLGIGLEAGLYNLSFDGTKIEIPEGDGLSPNDPGLPTQRVSGRSFDLGTGVYYVRKNLFVGLAAKHLIGSKVTFDGNFYHRLVRTYSLAAGYNIKRHGSLFSWQPSVIALTDWQVYTIDLNVQMAYNDRWFAAVSFRPVEAAGFAVGMKWGQFRIQYGFMMPISALARNTWGSHELMVTYSMPLMPAKDKGLRVVSARLL